MPRKIFIPNHGFHDFAGAEKFGELHVLTKGKQNLLSIGRMAREFESVIQDSSPEDAIMICGPAVMSVILCALFARKHDRLNLILYHQARTGNFIYRERNLILNGEQDD